MLQPTPDNAANNNPSLLSDLDIYLFKSGKHFMLYKHFGAHASKVNNIEGIQFTVWAPNAVTVAVIGDFNQWDHHKHLMTPRQDESGIWEIWIPQIQSGNLYKFRIQTFTGSFIEKSDPFAFETEAPPLTASKISPCNKFTWSDKRWMNNRDRHSILEKPLSIFEVHLGSWRRVPEDGDRYMTYQEMSHWLPAYCREMGFTHIELMPIMEHPFYGSWGYQITGYFAPTARYGSPEDLRYFINVLHKNNIGVLLDWVPAHFPGDAHGLYEFDGSHLYEHADPREGYHQDWHSYIFNFGRNEVKSFLISNALYWLKEFHFDGLRVDAVASMLYRDYSRAEGAWVPNIYGGRENLEAIAFLKELNEAVHQYAPGTITIAEESTSFPGVTQSVLEGGLGFDFKWMMGWMHDTIAYFSKDPLYRTFHQHDLTFSLHYAFTERFVLPLSHDEVVHGKGSLWNKMPGNDWQKAAGLRVLYAYLFGHPGAKLLFMGAELAQQQEWNHDKSIDWHLLENSFPRGIQHLIKDLNQLYTSEKSLYCSNYEGTGFEWIDNSDHKNSVFVWVRKDNASKEHLIFILNALPVSHEEYRIGVPISDTYMEVFNTDQQKYGGSGIATYPTITPEEISMHHRPYSISIKLPPLAVIILKPKKRKFKLQTKPLK